MHRVWWQGAITIKLGLLAFDALGHAWVYVWTIRFAWHSIP